MCSVWKLFVSSIQTKVFQESSSASNGISLLLKAATELERKICEQRKSGRTLMKKKSLYDQALSWSQPIARLEGQQISCSSL